MATWDDVQRIAGRLREVSGRWEVNGKTFAWERPLRTSDVKALGDAAPAGPIMCVRLGDLDAKEARLAELPGACFTTPHFKGYPAVLVDLERIDVADLDELLTDAWLAAVPASWAAAFPDPPPDPLQGYLATLDPPARVLVSALDAVVRAAHPAFSVDIKYTMPTYAIGGDWKTWVCAIGAGTKRVSVRFLYGVILSDPRRVLRGGTSVLMNWDFGLDTQLDSETAAALRTYVLEAVERYPEYKTDSAEILAAARARGATPR